MSFDVTIEAELASQQTNLLPQIVLEIEGVPTIFASNPVQKYIQFGDEGLVFGAGYVFGGLIDVADQESLISFQKGTTTTIGQQLNQDKGIGDSISTINIALVDKDEIISNLISPTFVVDELLGKRCRIWFGFSGTPWKDSYIVIFRGNLTDIISSQGLITFKINHPDDKKRSNIYKSIEQPLAGASGTFLDVDVDTATDTITANSHGLTNGTPVSFSSTGSLPSGLTSGFVVSATTNTFKVSATVGGSALDITTQGTGTHSFSGGISSGATVIPVSDTENFLVPITGPDGTISDDFISYVKIDDEIIRYETKTATQLQTITRGAFGTIVTTHSSSATVSTFYRLKGNGIDLALGLMLSGKNGFFQEDVSITNFVRVSTTETVTDAIFFADINLIQTYNIQVGDFVTVTGALNGANNVSSIQITGIVSTNEGNYITIDAAGALIEENDTDAVIAFRSQYDIYPEGLKMHNDECDIDQHEKYKLQFYSSFEFDFYIDEGIENAKDFLSSEIYLPMGAFSLPRKSQASMGVHFPPLPTTKIKTINETNVKKPEDIKLGRSTNRNFFNSIVYKFERSLLDSDKYLSGTVRVDGDSVTRFGDDVGNKTLTIISNGMRTSLNAENLANTATTRRLDKYKFGAEEIRGLKLQFGDGFDLETGDIILFEMSKLKITDIQSGTRNGESRLFEVTNKSINIKTGEIVLDIVDTSFSKDARYGLISPASYVKSAIDASEFVIEASFNTSTYGINEFKKWQDFIGASIIIRNDDGTIKDSALIQSITGNTIKLASSLSFTPLAGYIMEFDSYDNQPDNVKLIYTFMQDNATFADGKPQYQML